MQMYVQTNHAVFFNFDSVKFFFEKKKKKKLQKNPRHLNIL